MTNDLAMLLHLDGMFDTRMGTLIKLNPEVTKHIDLDKYRTREMDDFEKLTNGLISNEEYAKAYAERDNVTLSKSIITGMVPILTAYLESIKERYLRKVDINRVRLDLNTFPYILPGPTREDIRSVLSALFPPYVEINVVRIDVHSLTPEFMVKHYNGWVLYDFDEWLNIHHETLLVKPMREVSTIIPRIHKRNPEDYKVEDNEFLAVADRHGLFAMVMEDFIHIESVPVSDFSIVVPGKYRDPDQSSSSPSMRSDSSTAETKSS